MRKYLLIFIMVPFLGISQMFAPLKGVITDYSGNASANEKISFVGGKSKKKVTCFSNDSGQFKVKLPDGDKYNIMIESYQEQKEYHTISIPKAPEAASFQEMSLEIKFEHPKSFILNEIEFETGSAKLKSKAKSNLTEFSKFLKRKNNTRYALIGHTDNVGSDSLNMKLSLARAKAVRQFLILSGCSPKQFKCEGKGSLSPIASNNTADGRKQNRRTVISVLN